MSNKVKKFLIVRFSSIGDIVLTSPVVRSLYHAFPGCEIHFFTKAAYEPLVTHSPYIHKVHLLGDKLTENLTELRKEQYDHILDLHHNLRSLRVKLALHRPSSSFDKQNLSKYRLTQFKDLPTPISHVVERYGGTLKSLGASLDEEGLELFLPNGIEEAAQVVLSASQITSEQQPLAVVLGAKFATKRWPREYFADLLNDLGRPAVLIGGKDAAEEAAFLMRKVKSPLVNTVGKYPLLTSAAIMKQCNSVLTHDTGFMHIAAAFRMKIFSIWGNTVPELGMTPYKTEHYLIERQGLTCRPCSKIGYAKCPQGHFQCMVDILPEEIRELMEEVGY
ncbi:MAG: glycosyltransferase family 9 protein [Bacteroidota bacterium]